MQATSTVPNNDVAIIGRVLLPTEGDLPLSVARFLLKLALPESDVERMHELSAKAREGTLTEAEKYEIDSYSRVGHVLSALQLKARVSLKKKRART